MEIYLVGGAVRDKLLQLPVTDKDWVVVGSSVEQMRSLGYQQVGKDFAVFLHPKTHQEYALARTERKVAKGYKGFVVSAEQTVTLEQDLARRDLTINAMAADQNGTIIDPFGGQQDLKDKCLRHTSDAFVEDPVRVLRVARFAARFYRHGFCIADDTKNLMQQMVIDGEVDALVPERVWTEIVKTLHYDTPSVFFKTLNECGALAKVIPMFVGVKEHALNTLLECLDKAVGDGLEIKWSIIASFFDAHDVRTSCQQLAVPKRAQTLALLAVRWLVFARSFSERSVDEVYHFYAKTDVYRRKERFGQLLRVFECVSISAHDTIQLQHIAQLQRIILAIDTSAVTSGQMATKLPVLRKEVIKNYLKTSA